jgi:DNA sulfur modification protein DndB
MRNPHARPTDDILESAYDKIAGRVDDLLAAHPTIREKMEAGFSAKDLRVPKDKEGDGLPFMRPVIQKAIATVAAGIVSQHALSWTEVMARLAKLPDRIGAAPWLAVFNPATGKMISAKDNSELLRSLLYVHIAAPSKQAVVRARKSYKEIIGSNYPISEETLSAQLVPHTEGILNVPAVSVTDAPSDDAVSD